MTNNLQKPLGEGGFGVVYHGNINGSQEVAVKLLSQSSTQGYKEFKAEVDIVQAHVYEYQTNAPHVFFFC